MKRIVLIAMAIMVFATSSQARREDKVKNHNIIFNGDLTAGNLYTFAASSVVTGLANYYLLNNAFFENSFAYNFYSTNVDGLDAKTLNPMGLTARELFNNLQVGLKFGYQTYRPEFFNYGIYGTAHYKTDQLKVGYDEENMSYHRAQRVLVGATALLSLGSMEKPSRVIIEAGCRYSLGFAYKSPISNDKDQLNNGLVSHFGIKLASRGLLQNVGVFADITHFNMWKNFLPNHKLKNWSVGFTWTITPQQADERKDSDWEDPYRRAYNAAKNAAKER